MYVDDQEISVTADNIEQESSEDILEIASELIYFVNDSGPWCQLFFLSPSFSSTILSSDAEAVIICGDLNALIGNTNDANDCIDNIRNRINTRLFHHGDTQLMTMIAFLTTFKQNVKKKIRIVYFNELVERFNLTY